MAHFEKAKTLNGNLQFHIDRKNDLEKSEKRKYANNIDKEKTYLNYDMNYLLREDFEKLSTMDRYKKRLEELKENQPLVKVLKDDCELSEWQLREEKKKSDYDETKYYDYKHKEFRKDANTCCYFVIQIPRDEKGELCFKTENEQKEFFESVVSFMNKKIGNENIFNIQVHNDETTPHMHLEFVPTYQDKLNCKKVLNKQFLQTFHGELQQYLENDLGKNNFSVFSNSNECESSLELKELKIKTELENLIEEKNNSVNEIISNYRDNIEYAKSLKEEKLEIINNEYQNKIIEFQDNYEQRLNIVKEKTNQKLLEIQEQYDNNVIGFKENYEKRINIVKEETNKKLLEVQKQYDNNIIEFREAYNKEKERYNNMCFKYNKKNEEYKQLLHSNNDSGIVVDFKQMGKDTLIGKGKTYSEDEINALLDKIKVIETKYDYYHQKENMIGELNKQYEIQIQGLKKKNDFLKDNVIELKSKNESLEMYKCYVDEKVSINDYNKFKEGKQIIEKLDFGYDLEGNYGMVPKRKIVDLDTYKKEKAKSIQNDKINEKQNKFDLEM